MDKRSEIENDIIKLINKFDELKESESNLNKYHEICFETIKNDLKAMISFSKAFEYFKLCNKEGKIINE